MTYREAYRTAGCMLREAGVENESAESRFLLEHALHMNTTAYLMRQGEEMPPEDQQAFFALVDKRCARIPLQHLTGEQEFMGLSFFVNSHVLIPRQDTELLVEEALRCLESQKKERSVCEREPQKKERSVCEKESQKALQVLDLCTGSGCIAISIKALFPEAEVTGSDLSADALLLAKQNAARNEQDVRFLQSDLFLEVAGSFDVVVSNPPYIPTDVIPTLMPEVRRHEPRMALDGGADGLCFYRRIILECSQHVNPGGWVLFEIGFDQGPAVAKALTDAGFSQVEVLQDLAGLDRIVKGRKEYV